MICRTIVALALASMAAVAAAQEDNARDKKLFIGHWEPVTYEEDGKQARPRLLESISWTFTEDGFIWRAEDKVQLKGLYTVNPSKKPKEIDLSDPDRKFNGHGIYALEGDTLKIRFNANSSPRPTAFTTQKGTRNHFLLVLRRTKQ